MGLDGIELLAENEKFFNIRIPDAQAENISTIQNLVDTISEHLEIRSEDKELQQVIFIAFRNAIVKRKEIATEIQLKDRISDYLLLGEPGFKLVVSDDLCLETPEITDYSKSKSSLLAKILRPILWTPKYNWNELTVEDYIDAVCAKNYKLLIKVEKIKSQYEIYVAVAGIVVDVIGVDYFEIAPNKSFTEDYGVD